ncbi:hypothetical protein N9748_00820 [bacterium]|nr:hypothetical protein [bacterium]
MKNILTAIVFAVLFLASAASASDAKDFEKWNRHSGEGYRYVEYFAKSKDTRDGVAPDFDLGWQRFDFTFSRKHGWQFYVTLRLVPTKNPVRVRMSINGKDFVFEGTSAFNKMSWRVDKQFLDAVMKADQPIQVEETYSSNFKYSAVISPQGLADALKWVGDLR